jgi:hypothetical protein
MQEYMSDEARAYYAGGKRKMIGGVPCRVAPWVGSRTPGKEFVKNAAAGQVAIDGDTGHEGLGRFRFVPKNDAPVGRGKPSARGTYAYKSRFKVTSGWRPASISLAPYTGHDRYGGLTDTPDKLSSALRQWRDNGDGKPLREWLADTAAERRAYWAAYDAARAAEADADWRLAA